MRAIPRRPLLGGAAGLLAARGALAQAQELRLGALFPLSGPLVQLGDECFRGLELAVEERNGAGGLWSRPVRLVRADAPEEAQASAEARRLVGERVAAIFGSLSSAIALAATQVAELQDLPWFELAAPADALTERGFRNLFRSAPRAADLAAASIGAVEMLGAVLGREPRSFRLALLHAGTAEAQSISGTQEGIAQARGMDLALRLAQSPRGADHAALVQRLRAGGVEVVLHCPAQGEDFTEVVALFRAMRDAGWRPRMVAGLGGAYALEETARTLGEDFEGVVHVGFPAGDVSDRYAPGAPAFLDAYKRRYGMDPRAGQSLGCYFGARVFLDALSRAGGPDRERIRAAVLATDIAEGTTAVGWGARFDERGQNTRARPYVQQWQGGRLVAVAPPLAALAPLRPKLGPG